MQVKIGRSASRENERITWDALMRNPVPAQWMAAEAAAKPKARGVAKLGSGGLPQAEEDGRGDDLVAEPWAGKGVPYPEEP